MSPLGNAVGFVDSDEGDRQTFDQHPKCFVREAFGCDVEQLESA